MSGEGFKFQASVKDADGDMVNVRADSPEELGAYLSNFPVAEYAQFKANVRGGAALGGIAQPAPQVLAEAPAPQQEAIPSWAAAPAQQAAPQQNQGWGAAAQQAPQQQAPQGGGGGQYAGPPHPEGKTCDICPNVLEFKKTSTGKGTWRCSAWRWNNGTPNGHSSEWAN